jgi:hypothetical protein
MASTYKCLSQLNPAANTLSTLYTCPSNSTTISSLTICNTNATDGYFSVSVAVAAATDNLAQYIYYQLPILSNDTFIATCGFTLANTDVIRVYSNTSGIVFGLFGVEII